MPKIVAPLTATQIKNAKPKNKLYKLSDGGGLSLWVYPTGNKNWVLSIQKDGKRQDVRKPFISMTLAEARAWREEIRTQLAKGEPIGGKPKHTFKIVFDEWYNRWSETVLSESADQMKNSVYADVMPTLGHLDIAEIRPYDIVQSLKGMEARGVLEYLRRTKGGVKMAFDYAVARGLADMNPVASVTAKAFKKHEGEHFRALSPDELPLLIEGVERGLKTGKIKPQTYCLIYWQLLTWARPGQAAKTEWAEIDEVEKLWIVPADKMKKRREFVVPLAPVAFDILTRMREMNVYGKYVFEGGTKEGHMSRETVRKAMVELEIDTTAHGLRSLARTTLGDIMNGDVPKYDKITLKRCLSHKVDDDTDLAYDRSKHIAQRRPILHEWADIVAAERAKVSGGF